MTDTRFVETLIRGANPRPAGSTGPAVEWSVDELLSQIEHRSMSMDTLERTSTTEPIERSRRRGWLLAAASFAIVVLIGAIVLSLANQGERDVADTPTPTVGAPADEVVPASDATLTVTFDGTDCTFTGPSIITSGSPTIHYINDSDLDVGLDVRRLNEGVTYEEFKPAMNRDYEGLENRGDRQRKVFMTPGVHALTCVGWINLLDGPPDTFWHVGTFTVVGG